MMLSLADVFESQRVAGANQGGVEVRTATDLSRIAIHEVVIDSRQVNPDDLFVALPGERTNGHDYVDQALSRGAAAILVDRDIDPAKRPGAIWVDLRRAQGSTTTSLEVEAASAAGRNAKPYVICVDSTLVALQQLSAYWRDRFSPQLCVIGITGSVGKTTTKELIAQVLATRYPVLKNEGNLNNEIGVPLTLLKLRPEHRYAVVEMGMYQRGEIALFASLAKPQIGVVTMIAPVHLERLGTMENIALAKAELVEALPPDGIAILNDDDERVRALAAVTKARVMTYGLTSRANLWADDIESYGLDGIAFTLHHETDTFPMRVGLLGRHSVHTALRAAAVGLVAGLAWEEILEGFQSPMPQLRLAVAAGPFGSLVLDDTYNASEESVIAALNLFAEINGGPRVAVLGDMLELGDAEEQSHRNVGCRAALVATDIVCVGPRTRWIAEEAVACGAPSEHVHHVADNASALVVLKEIIQTKSTVLVKGSRGMRMEEIVTGLAQMVGLV